MAWGILGEWDRSGIANFEPVYVNIATKFLFVKHRGIEGCPVTGHGEGAGAGTTTRGGCRRRYDFPSGNQAK